MKANKLTWAKTQMMLKEPFFSTLAYAMTYEVAVDLPTACTNGKSVRFGENFLESISYAETLGVLMHELLHVAFNHMGRRQGRDIGLWNIACDLAINPLIVDAGYKIPECGLMEGWATNLSAEEIYEKLKSGSEAVSGVVGIGDMDAIPGLSDAQWNEIMATAKDALRRAGSGSPLSNRIVNDMLTPRKDWRKELAPFLRSLGEPDYSYLHPSRRYLGSGFILPSLIDKEGLNAVLMVDTSGSISDEELNNVASEMRAIAELGKLTVLYVDDQVRDVQEFERGEELRLNLVGGGGTDFKPGFVWLEEHHEVRPDVVVYFTDGCCSRFPDSCPVPLMWIVNGRDVFEPGIGEVVYYGG